MASKTPMPLKERDYGGEFWRKPLDFDEYPFPHSTIHLIKDRCKGCEFCIEFCPAGILELSDKFNSKGYHPPRVIDEDACYGCRLCELICPEFAIYINDVLTDEIKQER
ncbi:MAG: 4Fe-4S binding protein [Bacteroidales bacterium]|jgi:2-oxoglutarate ferredoxin oxidoreductase subunit delta|nr:4Fe-4S binding protein [Bacteroidales bacterium]